jgi:hypothetical protein
MNKKIDNHQLKFKKQITEFESMLKGETPQYWELIHNKHKITELRKMMDCQIENYNDSEENLMSSCKEMILKNLFDYMTEFN